MPRPDPPRHERAHPSPGGASTRRPLVLAGEASLRRRLAARDEQALVELIEVASPWLLGITQGMLSDPDEAQEVVLEVFATAWDRIGSLGDEHDALLPWLLRIARNRAIDRLRRRRRTRLKLERAAGLRRAAARPGPRDRGGRGGASRVARARIGARGPGSAAPRTARGRPAGLLPGPHALRDRPASSPSR